MKKIFFLFLTLCLLMCLSIPDSGHSAVVKWIRVGSWQAKIASTADMGESGLDYGQSGYYYYTNFTRACYSSHADFIVLKNWKDEAGKTWPYKTAGHGQWNSDQEHTTMPILDAQGHEVHKYLRYQPPSITVDGFPLEDPFPMDESEEVNPDKIPGTADAMVESRINTSLGITIHQRVLGWSQKNHDDYLIYEYTFKNTGNTDLDPEIELPNQTLTDVYYIRQERAREGNQWISSYGEMPSDTLRMMYCYPRTSINSTYDIFGTPSTSTGFLGRPYFHAAALLHADKSTKDHSDDWNQPNVTDVYDCDFIPLCLYDTGESEWTTLFQIVTQGWKSVDNIDYIQGAKPGFHTLRYDERGYNDVTSAPFTFPTLAAVWSVGPYTMAPGDSFRIVFAFAGGSISVEKGWEVGRAWKQNTCTWPNADKLPGQFSSPLVCPTDNDRAKDNWVYSGKDSLFKNVNFAQFNVDQNYNIPVAPPAPSVTVKSLPDKISLTWTREAESVSDFAGYRIYRAKGNYNPIVEGNQLIGVWEKLFECGAGTPNALTNTYDDTTPDRGQAYFYQVAAYDDASKNAPDALGRRESLESGRYLNRTTKAAYLTRKASVLDSVAIVPNPFNLGARDLQYQGESDKIMFLDLPPKCTIKIFTESGDLVKTIEHTSGSGDEAWGVVKEQHSTTNSGQVIVSGIYIAHIKTPNGDSRNLKFVVVR